MSANGSRSIGRRSLLAAGAAGALAVAVEALGAPARVAAADHDPVKLGEFNDATGLTRVIASGDSAIEGKSGAGDGLRGVSDAALKSGVYAVGTNAQGYGLFGRNTNTQNEGYVAGPDHAVSAVGHVANRAAIRGAHALPGEIAVQGVNEGFQTVGALGGTSGVGCYAPPSWNALEVTGKAAFTRAGVLTVAAGKQSATVSGIPLTALSFVLATPTRYRSGHWVAAAVPNAAAGTITIHLNRKAAGAVSVAWIVLERIQMV